MTNTALKARLDKAFIASSTNEPHHVQLDDVELETVALATNRIYMLDAIRPKRLSTGVIIYDLEKCAPDGAIVNRVDKLYASSFFHCLSHFVWSDFMKGLYVLKGMAEKLGSSVGDDYIDRVDDRLAGRLENVAYVDQMTTGYTPADISVSLAAYLSDRLPDLSSASLENCKKENLRQLWADHMRPMLQSPDACFGCRSKFLAESLFPLIIELMRLDKRNELSDFTFGIMSIFLGLLPQQYFVASLEDLKNKYLGFCPVRICAWGSWENGYGPTVNPSVDRLYQPTILDSFTNPFSLCEEFATDVKHQGNAMWVDGRPYYNIPSYAAISWALRYVLHYIWKNCPCPRDVSSQRLRKCPMEASAYEVMKAIFTEHGPDSWLSLRGACLLESEKSFARQIHNMLVKLTPGT
jgi:hypothetical protein